jgi:hypothetical protein
MEQPEPQAVERRAGSRTPLRIILIVLMALSGLWLYRLYEDPTWSKIGSFVLGYFVGTFVMDWVNQRSSRGLFRGRSRATPVGAGAVPGGTIRS